MAWIDDRVWCHPKLTDLTDRAFRAHVNAIAYSSGFSTRGRLTKGQQKTIGAEARTVRELVASGLWDDVGHGSILIHDWDEHNGKRDARRAADRERKKQERATDPDGWITRSGQWQTTRKAVFARDQGFCIDCAEKTDGWHADHVPDRKTLRERGDDPFDIQFIETRCHPCHARRHSLERHAKRKEAGTSTDIGTDRTKGQSGRPARVDGSEGSDGSDRNPKAFGRKPDKESREREAEQALAHLQAVPKFGGV